MSEALEELRQINVYNRSERRERGWNAGYTDKWVKEEKYVARVNFLSLDIIISLAEDADVDALIFDFERELKALKQLKPFNLSYSLDKRGKLQFYEIKDLITLPKTLKIDIYFNEGLFRKRNVGGLYISSEFAVFNFRSKYYNHFLAEILEKLISKYATTSNLFE